MSYIPDLKKRVTQKTKLETPETFLATYVERKKIRQSSPDKVDGNHNLSVEAADLRSHYLGKGVDSQIQAMQRLTRKPEPPKKTVETPKFSATRATQERKSSPSYFNKGVSSGKVEDQGTLIAIQELQRYKDRKSIRDQNSRERDLLVKRKVEQIVPGAVNIDLDFEEEKPNPRV